MGHCPSTPRRSPGERLARSFRVYHKKRGHRRTGSPALANLGETLFSAVLFALGCVGLAFLFATLVVPAWRVSNEFVKTTCVVLDKRVHETAGANGPAYRPEIQIRYLVNGVTYVDWVYDIRREGTPGVSDKEEILARFKTGEQYPCWYDTTNPSLAVLVRDQNWWAWLMFIVPVSLLVIGGAGLLYRLFQLGASAERRASIAQRAAQLELFEDRPLPADEYPYVPDSSLVTDSAGTTLAFRLPIGTSTAWMLFWLGMGCVLWNAIVSVFIAMALDGYRTGHTDWRLNVTTLFFLSCGIALLVFFLRQLVVSAGVGPTLVEVSDHPLFPGGNYKVFLSQSGQLKVRSLVLLLVCEEEATYRQGTDTRKETCRVFQRQIFRRENVEVRRGLPFEIQSDLEIPTRAMHSFKAGNNEVRWKLVVRGDVVGWSPYERAFPVVVYPATRCGESRPAVVPGEALGQLAASHVNGAAAGRADSDDDVPAEPPAEPTVQESADA